MKVICTGLKKSDSECLLYKTGTFYNAVGPADPDYTGKGILPACQTKGK